MKYGGAVLEYFFNPLRVANISVRGLVGGGTATLNRFRLEGLPFLGGRFPGQGNFGSGNLDPGNINLGNLVERLRGRFPFEGIDLDSRLEVKEAFLVMGAGGQRYVERDREVSPRFRRRLSVHRSSGSLRRSAGRVHRQRGRSVSILNTSIQFAQYWPISKDMGGHLPGLFSNLSRLLPRRRHS